MGFAVSRGELRECDCRLKGAQNLPKERLFGFGRRLALAAVAADELVVWCGVCVFAR